MRDMAGRRMTLDRRFRKLLAALYLIGKRKSERRGGWDRRRGVAEETCAGCAHFSNERKDDGQAI